jgi:prepilin-type N-terminal cleavage/methylation domain-containing protein
MSLMKLRRNRKGFTLIEMMIVIAVIAILAAVIIPRSGIVQNTAKESGVESNARIVQGIVENMAPRYKASEYVTKLLPAAANKIAKAGIVNPVTNETGVETSASNSIRSSLLGRCTR